MLVNKKYLFAFIAFFLFLCFANHLFAQSADSWRIKVYDSAIVYKDVVTLGDIAEPLGNISASDWEKIKNIQLFQSPPTEGKAMQINKQKLYDSLAYILGDMANYLLLPNSLAIQKNGELLREQDLQRLVINSLSPVFNQLDGQVEFTDFRLPAYTFLSTKGQKVEVEQINPKAGRVSLKFFVKEMDNSTIRSFTGSVFVNLWKEVPVPTRSFNKGEMLTVDSITYVNKNLAYISGTPWNGKGGPWQFFRAVTLEQPILESDLIPLAMIRKGQLVNLIYQKGNINISQQGEALQDGGPGDVINIRNTQSKKQVSGIVQDSQTVMIK